MRYILALVMWLFDKRLTYLPLTVTIGLSMNALKANISFVSTAMPIDTVVTGYLVTVFKDGVQISSEGVAHDGLTDKVYDIAAADVGVYKVKVVAVNAASATVGSEIFSNELAVVAPATISVMMPANVTLSLA